MPGPIRLNKVLKELNISLDRAVEFLNSKDIKIDARPTTKIDQKIYDLLSSEFEAYKSEKDVLDKINIQKRKEIEAKEILEKKDELKETEKKNKLLSERIDLDYLDSLYREKLKFGKKDEILIKLK